jgi:hypothetical protein
MLRTTNMLVIAAAAAMVSTQASAFEFRHMKTIPDSEATRVLQPMEELPMVVKKKIGTDMPVYLLDNRSALSSPVVAREVQQPLAFLKGTNPSYIAFAVLPTSDRSPIRKSIFVIYSEMQKNTLELQRHSVVHEAMHQFDISPGFSSRYSNRPMFLNAFRKDKAEFEAKLNGVSKDTREWAKGTFSYFFSKPYEAFADVTAWLMYPREDQKMQDGYLDVFAETTDYLIGFLRAEGIPININGNYKAQTSEAKPEPKPEPQKPEPKKWVEPYVEGSYPQIPL